MIFKKNKYNPYGCRISRKHAEIESSNRLATMSMCIFTGIVVLTFLIMILG